MDEGLRHLAYGPQRKIKTFSKYFINGYKFHAYDYGVNKSTNNSDICVKGSEDPENHISDYYGVMKEIIELTYFTNPQEKIILFKCDWFNNTPNVGINMHKDYKLIEIKNTLKYKGYDLYVLAKQAVQVYYTPFPSMKINKIDWWPRFFDIPLVHQELLFEDFKDMVDWGNKSEAILLKVWLSKTKRRYSGILSNMKQNCSRKNPIFIDKAIYDQFVAYWDLLEVKINAKRNSENRNKNISLHKGGTRSFQEHRTVIKEMTGKDPSTFEVYKRTHGVQTENEDGTTSYSWDDERSKDFIAEFKKENNEYLTTQPSQTPEEEARQTLTLEEENIIFKKITKVKKQRRYGYGNQEVVPSKSCSANTIHDVAELRAKLEEIQTTRLAEQAQMEAEKVRIEEERAQERAELNDLLEAERAKLNDRLEAERAHMDSRLQEMVSRQLALAMHNFHNHIPPSPSS